MSRVMQRRMDTQETLHPDSLSAAEIAILDGATAGTQVAGKAVVADSNVNSGISKVTAIHVGATGSEIEITATPAELNNAADVSARVIEVLNTAGGTIAVGIQSVELNHISVIAAATIADASTHEGLFIVKNTSASGTAAHTLTLTSGTFNGTNNVATLNAPNEALVVYFDSAGDGTILANVGSVALS